LIGGKALELPNQLLYRGEKRGCQAHLPHGRTGRLDFTGNHALDHLWVIALQTGELVGGGVATLVLRSSFDNFTIVKATFPTVTEFTIPGNRLDGAGQLDGLFMAFEL
jgi:hypothetical protein